MDDRLFKLLLVAGGGALGSVGRYGVSLFVQRFSAGYPWGTTCVNLVGSFGFGLVWAWTDYAGAGGASSWRVFLLSGFMGAFTTFSTLMFESTSALQSGRPLVGVGHVALHVVAGLVAVLLGLSLGKLAGQWGAL